MDEQKVQDMINVLVQQRESYANQVVQLTAELLAVKREIEKLTTKEAE